MTLRSMFDEKWEGLRFYSPAKLACQRFLYAGRRHRTPKSQVKDSLLVIAKALSNIRVSAFT